MLKISNFKNDTDNSLIYLLFVSIFLPYYLTVVSIIASVIYIIKKQKIAGYFEKNGGIWVILFAIYTVIVAAVNLNFVGVLCSFVFIALIIISKFVREHITLDVFENGLNIACFMGIITTALCLVDFVYNQFILCYNGTYRSTLYFFNTNYLATLFATVIIVCGYKVLFHKGKAVYYYITALMCAIGAYLTGSMFVWVEVFIGCAAILMITRKHQLLSALFLLAGTLIIVIYCIPNLIPRIDQSNLTIDIRIRIWKTTLKAIKEATPIFGRGFLTYFHVQDSFKGSYNTAHSHSILLEPILSFGIIGTILIVTYFSKFYKRVILCRNAQHKIGISSLILAVSLGILVHATTDLTFMWIQTALFYALIFSSIGIEEDLLKIK